MEIDIKCCNKKMIELNIIDFANNNIIEVLRFVCGECGIFKDIVTYALDYDELLNEIETYDELKNTKIHKELLKENGKCY